MFYYNWVFTAHTKSRRNGMGTNFKNNELSYEKELITSLMEPELFKLHKKAYQNSAAKDNSIETARLEMLEEWHRLQNELSNGDIDQLTAPTFLDRFEELCDSYIYSCREHNPDTNIFSQQQEESSVMEAGKLLEDEMSLKDKGVNNETFAKNRDSINNNISKDLSINSIANFLQQTKQDIKDEIINIQYQSQSNQR